MTDFQKKVFEIVTKIPKGRVATYKQVAILIGDRACARAVGNALHKNPQPIIIPCHRVVNFKGELADCFAFGGVNKQKDLLISEGVEVADNKVDLKKFGIEL